MSEFRVTFSPRANAAYIYIADEVAHGDAVSQVTCGADVVLDYDESGKLLGIEILAATRLLSPKLLGEATQLG